MTKQNYAAALDRVLVHEGGAVNHPSDPGGRTNKGVTQRVYDAYRIRLKKPTQTVYNIKPDEVQAIYRRGYWEKISGDQLPAGVDYAVFDAAVNSGPSRAAAWLQSSLRPHYAGPVDGVIGEATIAAAVGHPNHDELVAQMVDKRLSFVKSLKTFKVFGKGWTRRLNDVLAGGQKWATGKTPSMATFYAGGDEKATVSDIEPLPETSGATFSMGGGLATVAMAVGLAVSQLTPIADTAHVKQVIVLIVLFGFGVSILGAIRFDAARAKQQKIFQSVGELL